MSPKSPSESNNNEILDDETDLFQFESESRSNSLRSSSISNLDGSISILDRSYEQENQNSAPNDSVTIENHDIRNDVDSTVCKVNTSLEPHANISKESEPADIFTQDNTESLHKVAAPHSMKFIHPIDYNIPRTIIQPPSYRGKSGRKVTPVVYSAIGSLENVSSLASYGSFNYKVIAAANSKKDKKLIDVVNSDHTMINRRITEGSPAGSSDSKKISALSTTLSHTNLSDPLKVQKKPGKVHQRASSEQTNALDTVPITVPIMKTDLESNKKIKTITKKKNVTIVDAKPKAARQVELFRPSCDAYTPRMGKKVIKHKSVEERQNIDKMANTFGMGTIQKPNVQDALRRVAMILQQHIVKIERRFETGALNVNLFEPAMREAFAEENFAIPRYKCTVVNLPMARPGIYYGMRKIQLEHKIPTADDIYEFGHKLFSQVQLSSECSIVGLIYVERLMESAKVPVMANTWRPVFMCGLLLASKVWQDWSSWNIEFASVYPQFSIEAINKLELQFLKAVKWDLHISSSLYAKYYFALRALLEKQDFRQRYVRMVGGVDNVAASEAAKVAKRSVMLKEKSLEYLAISM